MAAPGREPSAVYGGRASPRPRRAPASAPGPGLDPRCPFRPKPGTGCADDTRWQTPQARGTKDGTGKLTLLRVRAYSQQGHPRKMCFPSLCTLGFGSKYKPVNNKDYIKRFLGARFCSIWQVHSERAGRSLFCVGGSPLVELVTRRPSAQVVHAASRFFLIFIFQDCIYS